MADKYVYKRKLCVLSFIMMAMALCISAPSQAGSPTYVTHLGETGIYSADDGSFYFPCGIKVNRGTGEIFIADRNNERVQVFDSSGAYLRKWGAAGSGDGQFWSNGGVEDIAIDSDENVWVNDRNNDRIQKFSSDGTYLTQIGGVGTGDGRFDSPQGIAIDRTTGEIYVADRNNERIQVFSSSGVFQRKWGGLGSGPGQFASNGGCEDIAIDASGDVWVTDRNNHRIQKFSSTGTFLMQIGTTSSSGSADGQFAYPEGIGVHPVTGDIYVADRNNHRVQVFDSSGVFQLKFGSNGTATGEFKFCTDLDFDANGDLWVVDRSNYRVQKFDVDVPATAPVVTTVSASIVSSSSATLGGNVTSDGGATVTERGIVYSSMDSTPEIGEPGVAKDPHSSAGTGAFSETIGSLEPGITYYFNAYALNSAGTSYGTAGHFKTLSANSSPEFDDADDTVSFTVAEDGAAKDISAYLDASDSDSGQTLTWSQGATAPLKGALSITGTVSTPASGGVPTMATYTPDADQSGSDTFTVNVSDGTETDTLTVNVIIHDAPEVSSIVRADSHPTSATTAEFTVTFSENVTGVSSDDFSLATSGTVSSSITGILGSGSVYTVIVGSLTGDGTLRLDISDDDSIVGESSVALGGAGTSGNGDGSYLSGEAYTVDNTAPGLTSFVRQAPSLQATNADSLGYRVTFDGDVQNVDAGDFSVNGTTGTVTNVSAVAGSSVYDLTISGGDLAGLNGTVGLNLNASHDITDSAGNALGSSEPGIDETYSVDNTTPGLISFARQTPASQVTRADSLVFRATFDGDVQNVSAADFFVSGTTGTVTSVRAVTGSSVFDVTLSGGDLASLTGTVGLNLGRGQDITDTAGNALPGSEPLTDEVYTVDNTPPTITDGQISISGAGGAGGAFNVGDTVTATWDNTGSGDANSDIAAVTVDFSDFGGGSAVNASNSRGTWTASYTLTTVTTDGATCNISVTATDNAGNSSTGVDTTPATIESTPPTVIVADGSYTEGGMATLVDSSATVTDPDGDAEWNGATLKVQLTANGEAADELSIEDADGASPAITVNGTDILANGIDVGDLSASDGVVTHDAALTIVFDADATGTIITEVLQSLRYRSTSENPGIGARTLTVTAKDKNGDEGSDTATLSIMPLNDAPVLSGDDRSLSDIDEDDTDSPGTTVAHVLASAGTVTDAEGASLGMAVTAVTDTHGTWQYTTDGSRWKALASASPAAGRALLLAPDDRLRFVPDADYYGDATGGITFKAWDGTSGTAGDTAADTTSGTAWSAGLATASITVAPVPGFSYTETDGSTSVRESGTSDTFTVVLESRPTSDVVITVASDDTGEVTVGAVSLAFTGSNWDTPQTVTVTGVPDTLDDGTQRVSIVLSVRDADSDDSFDGLSDQTVGVECVDDGITWSGGGENALWSNPDNWNWNRVPDASDSLVIRGGDTIEIDGEVALSSLTFATDFSGTVSQGDAKLTINGNLEINGGSFHGGTQDIDVNGSFIQTGGVFRSTSGQFLLAGDFNRSGGAFFHNEGAVSLDGGDQDIKGETTFYKLSKTVTVASGLSFEADTTQTLEGALLLAGRDDALLTLQSATAGQRWVLNPQVNAADVTLVGLDVRDCENIGEEAINCGNSVNSGNNLRVRFVALEPPMATLANHPRGATRCLSCRMSVGGIGVTHYKYRVNGGTWSEASPVTAPLVFTLENHDEGLVELEVLGQDRFWLWQEIWASTQLSWWLDRSAPDSVSLFNVPLGTVATGTCEITVGGEGVSRYKYSMDGGAFSGERPVSLSIRMSGLSEGGHTLAVIGGDAVGNWQDEADAEVVRWTVDPVVVTAALTGTPAVVTRETSVSIGVTGADSGADIDGYAWTLDGGATWETGAAGERIERRGLAEGDYTLYVNASGGGQWQDGEDGMTNIDNATSWSWTVDRTVTPVGDFSAGSGIPASTSVRLSWTVADDYAHYRIWYGDHAITEGSLSEATELFCDLVPEAVGKKEQFIVTGLSPEKTYYVAVKAVDRAGNESPLSMDSATTADVRPHIATLSLVAGGVEGDNSAARALDITGSHFLESAGSNVIRFENPRQTFQVPSEGGTLEKMTAFVPIGASPGVYNVRVINKNGVSPVAPVAYTVTPAPVPVPVVSGVSPVVVPTGTATTVTVTGADFGDGTVAVNLMAADGTKTALGTVPTLTTGTVVVDVDVSSDFSEGFYTVQVIRADTRKNEISSVKLELCKPVVFGEESGPVDLESIVRATDGLIPVHTTLNTDNRDEVCGVTSRHVEISATFEAGTILEHQDAGVVWKNYDGLVNPPRQVPLTEAVEESLGGDSVLFSLGADQLLRLKDGSTFFVKIKVALPADAEVPSIYYVATDGSITLAGVDGTRNGTEIKQGGTVLATRTDVPEAGLVTYTIGLVMNHMSSYAAGTKIMTDNPGSGDTDSGSPSTDDPGSGAAVGSGRGDSFGPCFIASSGKGGRRTGMGLVLLFGALLLGGSVVKRRVSMAFVIAVILVSVPSAESVAHEATATRESGVAVSSTTPWSVRIGLSYGIIDEAYRASSGGTQYALDVDNVVSPLVRVGYAFTDLLSFEVKAAVDFYSGEMETLATEGASSIRGYSFGAGPVWLFKKRQVGFIGTLRPFVYGCASYRGLKGGLAYPVNGFRSTLGLEAGAGVACGRMDLRLGYNRAVFNESGTESDYAAGSDDLDLSAVVLEVSWILPFNGEAS